MVAIEGILLGFLSTVVAILVTTKLERMRLNDDGTHTAWRNKVRKKCRMKTREYRCERSNKVIRAEWLARQRAAESEGQQVPIIEEAEVMDTGHCFDEPSPPEHTTEMAQVAVIGSPHLAPQIGLMPPHVTV